MTPRPAPRLLARRWTVLALFGVGLVSVAAWLAPLGWPFELFAHFRLQLAAAAIIVCSALALLRLPALAAVALLSALVHALPTLQNTRPASASTVCGAARFSVGAVNVQYSNHDHQRLLDWLVAYPADVVVLEEVTEKWASVLQSTHAQYPHQQVLPREDPYGIAILSRWPLESFAAVDLASDGLPSLLVTLRPDGELVQILGMHTRWPITPALKELRDAALQGAAGMVAGNSMRTVLVGDLNLTPYAPAFKQLLLDTSLQDAFADRVWRPTWRASLWPLALPIDHVLIPRAACIHAAQVGPDVGSDHRPVHVTVGWPRT
jgi:endonuclease/exonuclease/phosphatase (EEP) superfamily protein YafD